jgi:hypothetical protein
VPNPAGAEVYRGRSEVEQPSQSSNKFGDGCLLITLSRRLRGTFGGLFGKIFRYV